MGGNLRPVVGRYLVKPDFTITTLAMHAGPERS
jgi:hypothetical protein